MSLHVYLEIEGLVIRPTIVSYIREGGKIIGLTASEFAERYPDTKLPDFPETEFTDGIIYSANITHNLNTMADKAGIYEALWCPEEIGITMAEDLIEPLSEGLRWLTNNPGYAKEFNPPNGWGDYEGLVEFVEQYLLACIKYPRATVSVSR